MSDWEKIFYTSCLTIFGGVIVFCISQLIQRFVLEPIQELKKTIGEIRFRLNYYANVYPNDFEKVSEALKKQLITASDAFRESGLRLESNASAIPGYDFFEAIRWIPKRDDIEKASGNLIFISNNTFTEDLCERRERRRQINEVKKLLRMTE
jgi:hypothetical protein